MLKKLLEHKFFKDSFWTMAALCLLNVTIQFLIYPFINTILGAETYGNILVLISIVNIIAVSVGISVNNRRMVASAFTVTTNTEYNIFLLIICIVLLPISVGITSALHLEMNIIESLLFWLLICCTMWRYYADVEFRLNLNYKGYFKYYFFISIGYLIGMFVFKVTKIWILMMLPGELAGLIYIILKGSLFKFQKISLNTFKAFLKAVIFLILAQLLVQIVFNADRFILKLFSGGVAVTIYYIASLMGKTVALLTTPINSVIIGYLAKSKKEMTIKRWNGITGLCLMIGGGILCACMVASHIFIRILYPNEFKDASPFFLLANLAQIIYFVTGILTTVLLRYVKEKYQLYINIAYVFVFSIMVIPFTWKYGIWGFAYAILAVNLFRFFYVFILMASKIHRKEISSYKLG